MAIRERKAIRGGKTTRRAPDLSAGGKHPGPVRRPGRGGRSSQSGRPRSPEPHHFLFNKPDGVLTQFRPVQGKQTLSDFGPFPRDVHPVGRLDEESEGLLFLTNDGDLHHRLIDPAYGHPRTYYVQVERTPGDAALEKLRSGMAIGGGRTLPADVRLLPSVPVLWVKRTPIRFRKTVPTAWLEVTLREGKNRQVRKMTAAAGHPALRVVRIAIGPLILDDLGPGESRALTGAEARALSESLRRARPQRS